LEKEMKYVVMICDGMSDEPLDELEGKTPLAAAKTSHMDTLARMSEMGMVHTIPKGMKPDSCNTCLSILGYDPSKCEKDEQGEIKICPEDFYTHTGKRGAIISDDENLKKIAAEAKMEIIDIDRFSGNNDCTAKKDAAVSAIFEKDIDFIFIHIRSVCDACLSKDCDKKIKAIENIDAYIVGPLVEEIQGRDVEFRLLIMPYYPMFVRDASPNSDAVPYMLFDSALEVEGNTVYTEKTAAQTGNYYDEGYLLISHFLKLE